MHKTGYIVRSDNYRAEFSRGFLNRSLNFLSNAFQGAISPWKASSLYDDKLNETAVLIAVGRQNAYGAARIEELWHKILEICEKNSVGSLVVEDIPDPPFALSWPVFDGTKASFAYQLAKGFEEGAVNKDTDVGAFITRRTPESLIEYLADELNYLKFYAQDLSIARRAAEHVYAYNGTAAEATASLLSMSRCQAVLILDKNVSQTARYLKCPFIADPFVQLNDSELSLTVFTDKLGEIRLGTAYFESLYYNRFQLAPDEDIRKFEAAVRYQYLPSIE